MIRHTDSGARWHGGFLLILLSFVAAPVAQALTVDFIYGFENVPTGSYSNSDSDLWPNGTDEYTNISSNYLEIRDNVSQEGSKSLRMKFVGGTNGTDDNVKGQFYPQLTQRRQYYMEYYLHFQSTFDFGKGAKLPGMGGGNIDDLTDYANGCSSNKGLGFSTRYMWRENGEIAAYLYHNDRPSDCGEYFYTGWNAPKGTWFRLKQRVKTNDSGSSNGVFKVWINGVEKINKSNVEYTKSSVGTKNISNVFFSTFYGGKGDTWNSPQTQYLWFDRFKLEY